MRFRLLQLLIVVACLAGVSRLCELHYSDVNARSQFMGWDNDELIAITASPEKSIFATADLSGLVRLWHLASGHLIRRLDVPTFCYGVALSYDGSRMATLHKSGSILIWDMERLSVRRTLTIHGADRSNCVLSLDGSILAETSQDGRITIWSTSQGHQLAVLEATSKRVIASRFSPDGASLIISDGISVYKWIVGSKSVTDLGGNHRANVWLSQSVAESLRSLADEPVATRPLRAEPLANVLSEGILTPNWSLDVASSHDSRFAAVTEDTDIVVYNVRSGERIVTVSRPAPCSLDMSEFDGFIDVQRPPLAIAFSARGSQLLVVGCDGTLRVWDLISGKVNVIQSGLKGIPYFAAFKCDSDQVVALFSGTSLTNYDNLLYSVSLGNGSSRVSTLRAAQASKWEWVRTWVITTMCFVGLVLTMGIKRLVSFRRLLILSGGSAAKQEGAVH